MIDKRITPQVMCAACGHIFPSPVGESIQSTEQSPEQASSELEEVSCPECETKAVPKGVMQPTGFPSLETFKRNWNKSTSITVSSNISDTDSTALSTSISTSISRTGNSVSESLPKSSDSDKE